MLDDTLKTQLKAYLERLQVPIDITAFVDEREDSVRMRELLSDIAALSDKVNLGFGDGANERVPSFAIARQGEAPRIRFAGIPLGHEFTSLVLALLHSGGHPPKTDAAVLEQIRALPGVFRFETYISLSCHNCPDVVQALNLMAVHNPGVEHVMIDGALFQDEVNSRQIMAVPTVYMNGAPFGQGRMELAEILAKVDTGASHREAEKISAKAPFDLLVVGGGPAGAAAAIYAARKGIRTGLVAERFGGQVLDTLAIENFISVKATEGPKLVGALEEHVRAYEVDVIPLQRAVALQPGHPHRVLLESGASLAAKVVLIATGAHWREMKVPGEREYRGKGVAYCPHCDGPLFKGKRVAVIGGGNSGVEAAIDLANIVEHVTLIEFEERLRADAVLQKKLATLPNVSVLTYAQTMEVVGDGQKVTGLNYLERGNGAAQHLPVAGVFVQIGLLPNSAWLKETLKLNRFGEIEVDAQGQTSVPGVFAAGDVTTVPYKQIVIAIGEGAKAALGAFDYLIRHSE